ncbi:unnamed protein product [Ambrosiozyma monospora]|uniref:Unnamed protein product n=1 Tax=Ambrosiozyma monospora TaxID=43982 RepID=A0ACB5UBW1_AMBMO|nr:unnamed protein product [Ambrosiozyma monospora]
MDVGSQKNHYRLDVGKQRNHQSDGGQSGVGNQKSRLNDVGSQRNHRSGGPMTGVLMELDHRMSQRSLELGQMERRHASQQ